MDVWGVIGETLKSLTPVIAFAGAVITTWWAQGGITARRRKSARELLDLWVAFPADWVDERAAVERRLRAEVARLGSPEPIGTTTTAAGSLMVYSLLVGAAAVALTAFAWFVVGPGVAAPSAGSETFSQVATVTGAVGGLFTGLLGASDRLGRWRDARRRRRRKK